MDCRLVLLLLSSISSSLACIGGLGGILGGGGGGGGGGCCPQTPCHPPAPSCAPGRGLGYQPVAPAPFVAPAPVYPAPAPVYPAPAPVYPAPAPAAIYQPPAPSCPTPPCRPCKIGGGRGGCAEDDYIGDDYGQTDDYIVESDDGHYATYEEQVNEGVAGGDEYGAGAVAVPDEYGAGAVAVTDEYAVEIVDEYGTGGDIGDAEYGDKPTLSQDDGYSSRTGRRGSASAGKSGRARKLPKLDSSNCDDDELRALVVKAVIEEQDNLAAAKKIEKQASEMFNARFNAIVADAQFAYVNWYGKRNCQLRVGDRHTLTWED